MEQKLSIADFAALVGTTSKTIYGKINNPDNLTVNERLKTVKEKIKGREVTLIITDSEQIDFYKSLYGKDTVIDGEYYETLTDNNGNKPVTEVQDTIKVNNNVDILEKMFDKLNTVHNEYNNRLQQVNDELVTYKSKTLLLEDAKGREGYYINEINELKKENNRSKLYNKVFIGVITVLICVITYCVTIMTVSKSVQVEPETEQVNVQVEQPKAEPKPQPVKGR